MAAYLILSSFGKRGLNLSYMPATALCIAPMDEFGYASRIYLKRTERPFQLSGARDNGKREALWR